MAELNDYERYFEVWVEPGVGLRMELRNQPDILKELADGNYALISEFAETMPNRSSLYWPVGLHFFIKGKIVAPKAVEVIKTWELE